ncbi:MAG: transcriptional regulator, Fur family transcriptional regulator, ferric uptake regulator [Candidatus Saccharibacteria bacterium]|nr:transcriptional regulator, Fur family transcriptional regulator, ferric uptake regulator [Candidatus Saccharibacteria bacterium]
MSSVSALQQTLAKRSYSLTRPRRLVFEALDSGQPRTMRELCQQLQTKVDRASVYRTVKLFSDLGVITRLQIGWKYKLELSDNFSHHHHHFNCQKCGALINLPESPELEAYISNLAGQSGVTPLEHQLEIQGLCATCTADVSHE